MNAAIVTEGLVTAQAGMSAAPAVLGQITPQMVKASTRTTPVKLVAPPL